jgi:hypothetical protein
MRRSGAKKPGTEPFAQNGDAVEAESLGEANRG